MKKLSFFFLVLINLLPTKAQIPSIFVDGIFYNIISIEEMTVEVANPGPGKVYIGEINIPSKITFKNKEFSVIGIGERAFYNSRVINVNIAEGIKYIGVQAFYKADILRNITLPHSLNNIRFSGLAANLLEELTLHKNIKDFDLGTTIVKGVLKIDDSYESVNACSMYATTLYIGRNFRKGLCPPIMAKEIIISDKVNYLYNILDRYCEGEIDLQSYKYEKPTLRRYYDNIKGKRKIFLKHKTPPYVEKFNNMMADLYVNVPLYVPKESLEQYKQDPIWGQFFEIIGY